MKTRKVTIEVEVPWQFTAQEVLECVAQGFDEIGYARNGAPVSHQEQLTSDVESDNTQIGSATEWP